MVTCPNSNGVSQSSTISSTLGVTLSTLKPMNEFINSNFNGFTIELWFSFNATDKLNENGLIVPIIMFGGQNNGEVASSNECDFTSPWYNFALFSKNGLLYISAPEQDSAINHDCFSTTGIEFRSNNHIVSVYSSSVFQF